MYHRLCLSLCERSLRRASCGVGFQSRRLNHHQAIDDEAQRSVEIISTRFPDYQVLYNFPYINYASRINRMKWQFTVFLGAAIPATVCLRLVDIVPHNIALGSVMTGIVFILWLHSAAVCCNNLVGYIYLKRDKSKIILSYVNYWGTRVDLEIAPEEIIPLSDKPRRVTDHIFNRLTFSSRKETLKIMVKFGQITHESFKHIVGGIV